MSSTGRPGIVGPKGRLDAVGDVQGGEDAADVCCDGALPHAEGGGGDVGVAAGEEDQRVALAGGEGIAGCRKASVPVVCRALQMRRRVRTAILPSRGGPWRLGSREVRE